jgi:hypothetical protein
MYNKLRGVPTAEGATARCASQDAFIFHEALFRGAKQANDFHGTIYKNCKETTKSRRAPYCMSSQVHLKMFVLVSGITTARTTSASST